MYQIVCRSIGSAKVPICKYTKSTFFSVRSYTNESNERLVLNDTAKKLNFTQLSDWYKLTPRVISTIAYPQL